MKDRLFWLLISVCVIVIVADVLNPGVLTVLAAAGSGYAIGDAIAWRRFTKELTKIVKGEHP